MKWYPFQIFLPPAGLITFVKVANSIRKRYLTGQMYNVQPFWGEEFLDSGHLGRGKIQEMLQEYMPLCYFELDKSEISLAPKIFT